uniref:IRG-type G domain-containing protein n=1 Tax=Neogobius melanostomus TaxID=47308 RepID=A0A8C6S659_9GOBI
MDSFEKDMKAAIRSNDQGLAAQMALQHLEKTENLPVNIAVTGESGSGKSTLINALRGVDNTDEAAAPTGYVECTKEVNEYPYPEFPNITISDLPGVGTSTFKASDYLNDVGFAKFDFFIIVSNNRFKENDGLLAAEIQKMNKKFYFVRSKIDDTINAAKRTRKGFEEEKTLKEIKENCIAELEKIENVKSPKIFLVSSLDPEKYEFESLFNTIKEELPAELRETLLHALPNISMNVIKEKKAALEAKIKWRALASAVVAAVPIPGTSVMVDLAATIAFVKDCQKSLGLTKESLIRLSIVTNVSMEDINAEINPHWLESK